jgi:hypothetical protein
MEVYLSRSAKYGLPLGQNIDGIVTIMALFTLLLFCRILSIKNGSRLIMNTYILLRSQQVKEIRK